MSRSYCVYNLTCGYVEHVGTLEECQTWVRNVVELSLESGEMWRYEVTNYPRRR